MRCLLALSALIIVYIDPVEPRRLVAVTYASLGAYCLYSISLGVAAFRGTPFVPPRLQHWVDIALYAALVALTEGTNSIFFHFFFFSILVASFSFGFREGLAATVASVALFAGVGLAAAPSGAAFELNRALIRPVYLFLLGYMMAYWGGKEIAHRRKLGLLKDVSRLANPRLGIDHAIAQNLVRLIAFFGADSALLVRVQGEPPIYVMHRVDASQSQVDQAPTPIGDEPARALLGLPDGLPLWWSSRQSANHGALAEQCKQLADLLETHSFVAVTYRQQEVTPGRLYLSSTKRRFSEADAEFLAQAVDQMTAGVDNLVLLDELMRNAAQLERAQISRDIHDTTVQPYMGLKLALEALHRKAPADSAFRNDVKELVDMCALAVADLRSYAARIRSSRGSEPAAHLVASLREHARRYRTFYGIDVTLRSEPALTLTDRVAGEAFQIVSEALSNVYRHTKAKRAFVELRRHGDSISIEVGNEYDPAAARASFMPRSITERAASLGGKANVRLANQGHDVVHVTIPV